VATIVSIGRILIQPQSGSYAQKDVQQRNAPIPNGAHELISSVTCGNRIWSTAEIAKITPPRPQSTQRRKTSFAVPLN
jgi:hypothetical protein